MSNSGDMGPLAAMLDDGRRMHLQHGPIDLVIEANGADNDVREAYARAVQSFNTVLVELVEELSLLRRPANSGSPRPNGPVAERMWRAVSRFGDSMFITPMAAVAGAVADHVLAAMVLPGSRLARAYVNNGGDISLFLNPGETFEIGVCTNPATGKHGATVCLCSDDAVGGVATSGWRGRSHSLGIADAVTVLARDAALADAAATLIANAVDLPNSPRISRVAANQLAPDSDLGERPVTVDVSDLSEVEIVEALDGGCSVASRLRQNGLIISAFLSLNGRVRTIPEETKPHDRIRPITCQSELEPAHA